MTDHGVPPAELPVGGGGGGVLPLGPVSVVPELVPVLGLTVAPELLLV
jgi:hypothetical protein